jgi:hypothetical protein
MQIDLALMATYELAGHAPVFEAPKLTWPKTIGWTAEAAPPGRR